MTKVEIQNTSADMLALEVFPEICVSAVDNCPDGVIAIHDQEIIKVNRRAAQILGICAGDVAGKKIQELIRSHPSLNKQDRSFDTIVKECLESGISHLVLPVKELPQAGAFEMRVWPIDLSAKSLSAKDLTIDGQIYFMRLSSVSGQISQDYSMRHVQKLEALGGLMGGVAHEINTPSQFVGDSLSYLRDAFNLLLSHIPAPEGDSSKNSENKFTIMREDVKQALDQAVEGMDRIRTIASAVKEFARKDGADAVGTDLNHLIETAIIVARNSYKYIADIELDLQDWPPMTPCYPGEIQQVLLNLIVNAAHAIEDFQAENKNFHRGQILIRSRYDDETACIEVFDTGTGIADEIRVEAFSPYFTTKGVGRGTGQGLALCRKIANAHSGTVEITNHSLKEMASKGAVVRFTLPLNPNVITP